MNRSSTWQTSGTVPIWFARAVSQGDIEGYDARWTVVVDAHPVAPDLIQPTPGSTIRTDRIHLEWVPREDGTTYRVQVSDTPDFSSPIRDVTGLTSAVLDLDEMDEGPFHWRVASIDSAGKQGPFSTAAMFTHRLQQPPPDPRLADFDVEDGRIVLDLPTDGRRFRYQVARDRDFTSIVEDRTVDKPVISLVGLVPDTYHVRILSYEDDGYTSGFGPSRKVELKPWPYWPLIPLLALLAFL